jgi:hypothetical protein
VSRREDGRAGAGGQKDVVRRSSVELAEDLRDQVDFLLAACDRYDDGDVHFHRQAAVALRVLLVDSLLDKMKIRSRLEFYDSSLIWRPENAFACHGLVVVGEGVILPVMDPPSRPSERTWVRWAGWSRGVVLADRSGHEYTRFGLVHDVANKQGAHADLDLSSEYDLVTRRDFLGYDLTPSGDITVVFRPDGAEVAPLTPTRGSAFPDPVAPSIRQIAHEVLVSLACSSMTAFHSEARAHALAGTCCQPPFGIREFYHEAAAADSRNPIDVTFSRPVDPASLGIQPNTADRHV